MKYKVLFSITLLLCASSMEAQGLLKRLKNKAEQVAVNVAGNKIEESINKSVENKSKDSSNAKKQKNVVDTDKIESKTTDRIEAYSKYDFVAGSELLMADDFSQDEIGAFADKWNTNGKGEVVHLQGSEIKWLKMYQQSTYLTPNSKLLPESYTIEFDVLWDMQNKGYAYPEITFSLFNTGEIKPADNAVFARIKSEKAATISLQLGEYNNTTSIIKLYDKDREVFKTPFQSIKLIEEQYGKSMHIAISVHKQRFRLWVNENKVYDLPKLIDARFNQFATAISSSNYTDAQLGFYFTNFKIATGLPDTKSKLLTEGKLITTAIIFDVNSAVIKPSSAGAIKEIADVLQANPAVKIKIIGHTDSDGDSKTNKTLSLKRAEAVREALSRLYKIDTARLDIDGKGEELPMSDNTTPAGKAQNRRVEFLKL